MLYKMELWEKENFLVECDKIISQSRTSRRLSYLAIAGLFPVVCMTYSSGAFIVPLCMMGISFFKSEKNVLYESDLKSIMKDVQLAINFEKINEKN